MTTALIAPEQIDALVQRVQRKEAAAFETKHRTKSGEIRDVQVIAQPMHLSDNTLVHCIVMDITERKRSSEQMRLQGAALQSAANAITIADSAGIIEWVNPAFTELTGYAPWKPSGQTSACWIPVCARTLFLTRCGAWFGRAKCGGANWSASARMDRSERLPTDGSPYFRRKRESVALRGSPAGHHQAQARGATCWGSPGVNCAKSMSESTASVRRSASSFPVTFTTMPGSSSPH